MPGEGEGDMAKFKVGDRVRILRSDGWPELAGQEGWVVPVPTGKSPKTGKIFTNHKGRLWAVAPVCWGSPVAPRPGLQGGGWFAPDDDQLEPILPTPTAMDILRMEGLPEGDCPAPVTINAPEWPRQVSA